jgi:hypothetical protein
MDLAGTDHAGVAAAESTGVGAVGKAGVGAAGIGDLGPQVTRFRPARLLSYSASSAARSIASASALEAATPSIVAIPKLAVTASFVSTISNCVSAHSRRIRSAAANAPKRGVSGSTITNGNQLRLVRRLANEVVGPGATSTA